MNNTYVAIMAGGIGSRFWPESRSRKPKQFLDILGKGHSLIRSTFDRFAKFVPPQNIYIVTNRQYAKLVKDHIPGIQDDQIMAEPMRRNTAPCVAYFSYKLTQKDPQANLIIAPSDHLVTDEVAFQADIEKGISFVDQLNTLLTLGIKPSRPDTNYGYIQFHDQQPVPGIFKVKTFTEKPNLDLAKSFLKSGDFLWNSGIFLWHGQSILAAINKHLPEMAEAFDDIKEELNGPNEKEAVSRAYSQCKNISIDYGIMEKAENVHVISSNFGWCDLGTWTSLWDEKEKDMAGNAVQGKHVMIYDAENNVVHAPKDKLVVLSGLNDYCVIDTDDVLMICKKSDEGRIKEFLRDVQKLKGDKFI